MPRMASGNVRQERDGAGAMSALPSGAGPNKSPGGDSASGHPRGPNGPLGPSGLRGLQGSSGSAASCATNASPDRRRLVMSEVTQDAS